MTVLPPRRAPVTEAERVARALIRLALVSPDLFALADAIELGKIERDANYRRRVVDMLRLVAVDLLVAQAAPPTDSAAYYAAVDALVRTVAERRGGVG